MDVIRESRKHAGLLFWKRSFSQSRACFEKARVAKLTETPDTGAVLYPTWYWSARLGQPSESLFRIYVRAGAQTYRTGTNLPSTSISE